MKRDYSFLEKGRIFGNEVFYGVGAGLVIVLVGGPLLPVSVTMAAALSGTVIFSTYKGISEGADQTTLISGVGFSLLVVAVGGAYYLIPAAAIPIQPGAPHPALAPAAPVLQVDAGIQANGVDFDLGLDLPRGPGGDLGIGGPGSGSSIGGTLVAPMPHFPLARVETRVESGSDSESELKKTTRPGQASGTRDSDESSSDETPKPSTRRISDDTVAAPAPSSRTEAGHAPLPVRVPTVRVPSLDFGRLRQGTHSETEAGPAPVSTRLPTLLRLRLRERTQSETEAAPFPSARTSTSLGTTPRPLTARTRARAAHRERQLAEALEKLEELREDLEHAQSCLKGERTRSRRLAAELRKADERRSAAETERDELEGHLTRVIPEKDYLKEQIARLIRHIRHLEYRMDELGDKHSSGEEYNQKLILEIDRLVGLIRGLESERDETQSTLLTAGLLGSALVEQIKFLKSLHTGDPSGLQPLSVEEFSQAHPTWFNPSSDEGHCLYLALAQASGNGFTNQDMHEAAVAHILQNPDDFSSFTPGEDLNAFIDSHLSPGTWGDYVIATAIATQLNFHIIVHQFDIYGNYIDTVHINNTASANRTLVLANFANLHFYAPNL